MNPADLTYRPMTAEELPAAYDLLGLVFGEPNSEQDFTEERLVQNPARSQGAFDGDTLVGSLTTYALDLSVPGGVVPCAGLTWVSVAPTHRRRGVLSTLMTRHLDAVTEPVAALWASETAIYGRFGYGLATEQWNTTVSTGAGLTWSASAPPPADRVRLIPLEDAAAVLAPIFEACRRRRGGMTSRTPDWWRFQVLSTRTPRLAGAAKKLVAVSSRDGEDVAYAVYGMAESWTDGGRPDGSVRVVEMMGVDAAAEAGMWRYLSDHDLTTSMRASRRPIDDALPLMLEDSRRVARNTTDGLFVRVMDVQAAFTGRTYAESVGVTIEVADPRVPANDGVWRIEVAPEGSSVTAVDEAPDLAMDAATLGSLYLGGISVSRLAAAGRMTVHNPDVIAPLANALRPAEAPWAPEVW